MWLLPLVCVTASAAIIQPPEATDAPLKIARESVQWPIPKSGLVPRKEDPKTGWCISSSVTTSAVPEEWSALEEEAHTVQQAMLYLTGELAAHSTPCTDTNAFKTITLKHDTEAPTPVQPLGPDMHEAYELKVDSAGITVTAGSPWGARHAITTLHNMLEDTGSTGLRLPYEAFTITDEPRYPHRGLSFDTSRHYQSWKQIYDTVRGLSRSKQNVFHWHGVDNQGFPWVMPKSGATIHGSYPCGKTNNHGAHCFGAVSDNKVYYYEDMQNFVQFARQHGVRVIFEADMPAHAASWCLHKPELCSCAYPALNIAATTLDIVGQSEAVLTLAKQVIEDLNEIALPGEFIHLGGDEVPVTCVWADKEAKVAEFLATVAKHIKTLDPTRRVMVWNDGVSQTTVHTGTEEFVVQVWKSGDVGQDFINQGRDVVWSNQHQLYLNCGRSRVGTGVGLDECDPYKTWWRMYAVTPEAEMQATDKGKILGGESASWAEMTDETILEQILWPRVAAYGGALWEARDKPLTFVEGTPLDAEALEKYKAALKELIKWVHAYHLSTGAGFAPLLPSWCDANMSVCLDYYGKQISSLVPPPAA